jgi:hypothetical protein
MRTSAPLLQRHAIAEVRQEMEKTPKNQEGQPPTKDPDETVDRLEQKKREGIGGANRERIEDQEREVTSER